jgi:hypothetical protein
MVQLGSVIKRPLGDTVDLDVAAAIASIRDEVRAVDGFLHMLQENVSSVAVVDEVRACALGSVLEDECF